MGSICTPKPASLPTALTMSTITPSMVLVLVSRKVNGVPVGVEPTFKTVWAEAAPAMDSVKATRRADASVASFMVRFLFVCQVRNHAAVASGPALAAFQGVAVEWSIT